VISGSDQGKNYTRWLKIMAILRLFVEIVGDRPLKSVDAKIIREYKQALMRLPANLKKKGETRLFPELQKRRDGYGQTVSKWFARYKKRCGIVEDGKKKDFHSFRHTFINALKQNREVEPVMISELVGHLVDSMTMGRYGKRYNLKVLHDAIKTLSYPVNLKHLKASEFVKET
jgi:integrase